MFVDVVRLQAPDEFLHAPGFELEDARGGRVLQQGVGGRIVQRNVLDAQRLVVTAPGIDDLYGPVDDRQRLQAQEVELHEPGALDVVLVELGDEAAARFVRAHRHESLQPVRRDHHPTRMTALVADDSLEPVGHVHDLGGFLVLLDERPEVGAFLHGLLEGHADLERDHLGEPVPEPVGLALGPRHVPHHGLGRHGPEGDDLADRIAAVAFRDMPDHAVAPFHAEVHIEIRQGHPLRIQEALEEQVVVDGIEVGDPERVGHQRPGAGTPSGTHGYVAAPRPGDEFHDHQEVAGESHFPDDVQFVLQPLFVDRRIHLRAAGRPDFLQAFRQPRPRPLRQVGFQGISLRYGVARQVGLVGVRPDRAAARDFHGVLECLRQVREEFPHLLAGSQVLGGAVPALPARVVEGSALLYADPGLVRLEVVRVQKADIVGGDHRQPAPGRKLQGISEVPFLIGPAGAL